MEEGAGMAPRRSAPVHPQIQPSEDSAGLTCRRSSCLCLHPQIQASVEGAGVLESLPFNDDMLREILLRLPPLPSSLPRASAVCKRWRGLVTDPKFHRQFYALHRKPPLLGVFRCSNEAIVFTPVLDPPDCIHPQRFDLGFCSRGGYELLDCRHGLVLVNDWVQNEVLVCDPITSGQRHVASPPEFRRGFLSGAVLCAAGDHGHVHGGCHSGPFKVVLVKMGKKGNQPFAYVYSSETGEWGNLILTAAPCEFLSDGTPATLVGNALYWLSSIDGILEFELDGQSLAVIAGPPVTNDYYPANSRIIHGEGGTVGFGIFSWPLFQTWQRNVNGHGVFIWVPWKTIEMHTLFGLPSPIERMWVELLGYDEDNDVIILYVEDCMYMVQLMPMQSRKLWETHDDLSDYHPFTSFFAPGMSIAGL